MAAIARAALAPPPLKRLSSHRDRILDPEVLSQRVDLDGPHFHEEGGAHIGVAALTDSSPAVVRARQSFALAPARVRSALSVPADYDAVLAALIRNAKIGPFTATSGVVLPFYLNAGTNFLDKTIAPAIARMTLDVLQQEIAGQFTAESRVLARPAIHCRTRLFSVIIFQISVIIFQRSNRWDPTIHGRTGWFLGWRLQAA